MSSQKDLCALRVLRGEMVNKRLAVPAFYQKVHCCVAKT